MDKKRINQNAKLFIDGPPKRRGENNKIISRCLICSLFRCYSSVETYISFYYNIPIFVLLNHAHWHILLDWHSSYQIHNVKIISDNVAINQHFSLMMIYIVTFPKPLGCSFSLFLTLSSFAIVRNYCDICKENIF